MNNLNNTNITQMLIGGQTNLTSYKIKKYGGIKR